jgi:hypothetical protein
MLSSKSALTLVSVNAVGDLFAASIDRQEMPPGSVKFDFDDPIGTDNDIDDDDGDDGDDDDDSEVDRKKVIPLEWQQEPIPR